MLEKFVRLMVWWYRKWYPVFRFVGRVTRPWAMQLDMTLTGGLSGVYGAKTAQAQPLASKPTVLMKWSLKQSTGRDGSSV